MSSSSLMAVIVILTLVLCPSGNSCMSHNHSHKDHKNHVLASIQSRNNDSQDNLPAKRVTSTGDTNASSSHSHLHSSSFSSSSSSSSSSTYSTYPSSSSIKGTNDPTSTGAGVVTSNSNSHFGNTLPYTRQSASDTLRHINNGFNHASNFPTYNPFSSIIPSAPSFPTFSPSSRATICGRQYVQRSSKVVGGNDTYLGEFPWTVSVRRNDHHHCGGVIVGSKWILTAAHCVQSRVPSNFIIRIGEYDLHKPEYTSKDYPVDKIVIHENYSGLIKSSLTSINGADIALLRTKYNITMNEYAWPVCFPSNDAISYAGLDAIVVGWGKRNEKSDVYSSKLQKVRLPIIENKICKNWFKMAGREMAINDKIICAGYKDGGKDACHGDSGGPLLAKINNQWSVIGVVSTGIGCARPLLPGLYSRVSSYYKWIEKYTNSE